MLAQSHPEVAERLLAEAQRVVLERWRKYEHLAAMGVDIGEAVEAPAPQVV
jgi:hypothetical protein